MNETSKASLRRHRDPMFGSRYFVGHGIDIGGGLDSLGKQVTRFPKIMSVRNWDLNDGDAQYLNGVDDNSFDFVYSSHCLEHMQDPVIALKHWLRVLKPGGHLIISVPDEDMYEHGIWPSRFNLDHKWSFTLFKDCPLMPKSINVMDLAKAFALEAECERILKIKDGYESDLFNIDQTLGNAECAIEFIWQKKRLSLEQLMQIADHMDRQGERQKAVEIYAGVVRSEPLIFEAYNRLANVLQREGRVAHAQNVWHVCLQNMPQLHLAHLYRALQLISIEQYDEGFRLRDALVPDERRTPTAPPKTYSKWQGESLKGKSIVIWTEFGFGDEIMFARFVHVFKCHFEAAKVSIVCQHPLLNLFKTIPSVDLAIGEDDVKSLPEHDFWVFPHSIPVHYSLEKHGIPASTPYFQIPNSSISEVEEFLPPRVGHRLRVGLVTKGSPTHENDQARSMASLCELEELFQISGIDWIDMQKEGKIEDFDQALLPQYASVAHVGGQLSDFMRTGAVCSQLDLLICVDTSTAHLAGALNIPVWLMLPTFTDWRWGIHKAKSPWYPSMRIFRQENPGSWSDVVRDIRFALCQKLRQVSLN